MDFDDFFYNPLSEFRRIQRRMHRMLGEMPSFNTAIREPLIDIANKGDAIAVTIELPGVRKEDIELNLTENTLAVRAKAKHEEKEEKKGYYYHERGFQEYSRLISLPAEVIPSTATAKYNNGVLVVTIKKKTVEPKAKGFKVKIE